MVCSFLVPDVSWPNLGNCMYPDPNAQHVSHDKEQGSIMENTSHATNSSKLEVRADANVYSETVVSSEATLLQPTDLSIGSLPLKKDNRSLSEGVDVGHIPIIFPTARPPYFFCDSQLFIQDPQRPKECTRVCVESRGTSPIQCPLDLESKDEDGPGDQQVLKDTESKQVKVEPEKVTLNAAVQTNESLSLTVSVKTARTAEISIQTSDTSDAESISSEASVRDNCRKNLKLRKERISCDLKLTDAAICHCKENSLKYCSAIKQESLITRAVKDVALAEIVTDRLDCKSKPISSCRNCLPEISLQANGLGEREMSESDKIRPNIIVDSCDKSDILLKPVSHKSLDNIVKICADDRNLSETRSTRFVDLVEAVNAELSNCTDSHTKLQRSSFKPGLNEDLDDLVMLSTIASTQLPATPCIILSKQETKEEGSCSSRSGRRLNVDLDISEFVECEHSPDVSTSYNVPKSCFFSETEFPSNSKGYLQRSNSDELKEDDLMSGILKPDKGKYSDTAENITFQFVFQHS